MFHAIDGKNEYSGTPEWEAAYAVEIQRDLELPEHEHPITHYASSNAQEGFAEYGRLVVQDPDAARDMFPQCWGFLEKSGLVEAPARKMPEPDPAPSGELQSLKKQVELLTKAVNDRPVRRPTTGTRTFFKLPDGQVVEKLEVQNADLTAEELQRVGGPAA